MKALLLIAHGSRRQESNTEIGTLTNLIEDRQSMYDLVSFGFLELAQPDIVAAGKSLIENGATSITVFPYFLVAGKHVITDVPDDVAKLQSEFPDVSINFAPYFGSGETIPDQILHQLESNS